MHEKKLYPAIAAANTGGVAADGVSFDGRGDYLYRNTDLAGNTDSTQFTFACWLYWNGNQATLISSTDDIANRYRGVRVYLQSNGAFVFDVFNDAGAIQMRCETPAYTIPVNTVTSVLISADVSDSTRRHCYISDNKMPDSVFQNYINTMLNFTAEHHILGAEYISSTAQEFFGGRMAHLFRANEYANLDVEPNRRILITDKGFPVDDLRSSWISAGYAEPVFYFPMRRADTAYINDGVGGDFEQNGVLDTAQVGFNEWQCVASSINSDLSNTEYLSEPSTGGYIAYSAITLVFITDGSYWRAYCDNGANPFLDVVIYNTTKSLVVQVSQFSPSYINMGSISIPSSKLLPRGAMMQIGISIDITNGKWNYCVNGEASGEIAVSFASGNAQYSNIQIKAPTNYEFKVGEYWSNFSYTVFAVDNPHWDSELQRPKPVRQVMSETELLPRIALPVRSGEEGKNLGAANDFTVYSGPFVGVRGMSEHIARSVFSSGGNNGVNDMSSTVNCSDTFTVVFPVSFKADYWNTPIKWHDGTRIRFELKLSGRSSGSIELKAYSSSGTEIFRAYKDIAGSLIYGEWSPFYLSIDRSEGIFKAYYKDTLIDLAVQNNGSFYIGSIGIFGRTADGYSAPCEIGPMYFTDSAVNIASEEIRNLFFDQLGNSKDLTPAIQEGLIPAPIFHLEFIDTNDLGLDSSGNNNHFTVNGNVTPGADFHA